MQKKLFLLKLRFQLLLKNNLPLGIYFYVRNKIKKYKRIIIVKDIVVSNVFFDDNHKKEVKKTIQNNQILLLSFLKFTNNFLAGKVAIFSHLIEVGDFKIDKIANYNNSKDIHLNDLRFYWEIFRLKFLVNVCYTYIATGKKEYVEGVLIFFDDIDSFSPLYNPKIRWNGMEAAISLMNLSVCYFLVCDYQNFSAQRKAKWKRYLISLAEYVFSNYDITKLGIESNHSLTCSAGLIYASLLFPDYKSSKKWERFGINRLKKGFSKQYSKDGVNFESSTQYHRMTLELFLFLLAALEKKNHYFTKHLENEVKKIISSLYGLTHSNGDISRFGDNDGGKLFYDFGTILEFTTNNYFDWFIENERKVHVENLLFINSSMQNKFILKRSIQEIRFGNYLSFKNKDLSIIVSGNQIGTNGKGNHQHNDFLSFELFSKYPFIVDKWSYCYSGNKPQRNIDRSTLSHNNITIDNSEIIIFNKSKLFELLGDIKVKIISNSLVGGNWNASLEHDGYKNLKSGAQYHRRHFNYTEINSSLIITDELFGKGLHLASLMLLIPKKYWELKQEDEMLYFSNDHEFFTISSSCENMAIDKEDSISEQFLNITNSYRLIFWDNYKDRHKIVTKIRYYKNGK